MTTDDKPDALMERLNEWADSHETMPDGGTYEHGEDCRTAVAAIRELREELRTTQAEEGSKNSECDSLAIRLAAKTQECERLRGVLTWVRNELRAGIENGALTVGLLPDGLERREAEMRLSVTRTNLERIEAVLKGDSHE